MLYTFEQMVEKRESEMIQKNLLDVRNNIDKTDYQLKISNYCSKFNFCPNEVKKQIMNNDIVASFFAKDPSKQNFTEKLVAELLNTKTLPQQGKNCIRFNTEGEITSANTTGTSKAADFYINNVYITQKYTRGNGGAQDNQYNDVVDFLSKGSLHHKVAAIVDGSYWSNGKREKLKSWFKENSNVSIYTMDELLTGGIKIE